jgi:hypothetical protein
MGLDVGADLYVRLPVGFNLRSRLELVGIVAPASNRRIYAVMFQYPLNPLLFLKNNYQTTPFKPLFRGTIP